MNVNSLLKKDSYERKEIVSKKFEAIDRAISDFLICSREAVTQGKNSQDIETKINNRKLNYFISGFIIFFILFFTLFTLYPFPEKGETVVNSVFYLSVTFLGYIFILFFTVGTTGILNNLFTLFVESNFYENEDQLKNLKIRKQVNISSSMNYSP